MTNLPEFQAPWHAQVFALAQLLVEQGRIEPNRWAQALGAERRRQQDAGEADTEEAYYQAVVLALENCVTDIGISAVEIQDFTDAWRAAYHATPHGQPVQLA